jgi:AbrB family looped-hinge helix DNA binding protein
MQTGEYQMNISTVGKRGQITLPSRIRRQAGIQEGDRLAITIEDDHIIIQLLPETLHDLRGSVPVSEPQDFDVVRQHVQSEHAQQRSRHAR